MKLGTLLRKLRTQRKLSQSELAEQIGVGQSTYCTWESDRSLPKAIYYAKLATLFGVDLSELLTDELLVTVSAPLNSTVEPTALSARTLYEELTNAQKQTILLQQERIERLEAENQRLRTRLVQAGVTMSIGWAGFIDPIEIISYLIKLIVFPVGTC